MTSFSPSTTAADIARQLARVISAAHEAGFSVGGHWSGDLVINRRDVDHHDSDRWSDHHHAAIGFEDTSEGRHWRDWLKDGGHDCIQEGSLANQPDHPLTDNSSGRDRYVIARCVICHDFWGIQYQYDPGTGRDDRYHRFGPDSPTKKVIAQ